MANNSNVSNAIYPCDSYEASFHVSKNANIDANYGPWVNTDAYETWLYNTRGLSPKEGTLIAVQPTEHADVTLYVYTSNVGDGTWKPVGSGGTGADDIGYVDHNVDVDILEKKVVSTSANQGLNPTQQDNARKNIGAVATDAYNSKVTELTGMIHNLQVADTDPGSAYALRQELTSGLALKADKTNTVTTDTNQTTDENGPITGYKSFTGAVDFAGPTVIGDVTLQGNTVFTEKDPLFRNNTVTINSKTATINSEVKFPKLDPGILTVDSSGEHKVVTVPASSFTSSSSAYITPDWNNNTEGTNGYIDNKPLISTYDGNTSIGNSPLYEGTKHVIITDDFEAKGNLVLGTYYEDTPNTIWKKTRIYGNVEIHGGNEGVNIGSSQRSTNLTVNGNTTITGSVSLGTGVSDIAKTITLGSIGTGNVADTINVNGTTTVNGALSVTGNVNLGTETSSTPKIITLGAASTNPVNSADQVTINGTLVTTGSANFNSNVTLGDNTADVGHDTTTIKSQLKYMKANNYIDGNTVEPGILVRDENGNVTSTERPNGIVTSVSSIADLPINATDGELIVVAESGDTYKHVTETVVTPDTKLHVSIPNRAGTSRTVKDVSIATTGTAPLMTEGNFFALLGESTYNNFTNYESIPSSLTDFGYDVNIVPVATQVEDRLTGETKEKIALVLVYEEGVTDGNKYAFVASRSDSGTDSNTWYLSYPPSATSPSVIDVSELSAFPADGNYLNEQIQYFVPNSSGNETTQSSWKNITNNSISFKTINGVSIQGIGNFNTTPASVLSKAAGMNSVVITTSQGYEEIDYLLDIGFVPLLKVDDTYYHLYQSDQESISRFYSFSAIVFDDDSSKWGIKIYKCLDNAEPTWDTPEFNALT